MPEGALDLALPRSVHTICDALRADGWQAFVVGGGVRDALLGRPVHDWDVATDAPPDRVQQLFARTIPTGVEFGTVTVVVDEDAVQVTTFRSEGGYRDARHPGWVTFGRRIEDDLKRRDLTVNALAYDPHARRLVDPYGGRDDLAARVIRTVGDPIDRFREDALRLLRAVRLAVELGFRLDGRTAAAARSCAASLARVSRERVGQEWRRLLAAPAAGRGLLLLHNTRLLRFVLPGARHLTRETIRETAAALAELSGSDGVVKMSAVLVGLSGDDADEAVVRGLVYSRAETRRACHLAQAVRGIHPEAFISDAALRRHLARVGREHVRPFVELWQAWRRIRPERFGHDIGERTERILAAGVALSPGELAVNGHDLQQGAGVPAGPAVGQMMARLWQHVLEFPQDNVRERLLQLARAWSDQSDQ